MKRNFLNSTPSVTVGGVEYFYNGETLWHWTDKGQVVDGSGLDAIRILQHSKTWTARQWRSQLAATLVGPERAEADAMNHGNFV